MGINCFETPFVMGYKRVPLPPARIIPFILLRSMVGFSVCVASGQGGPGLCRCAQMRSVTATLGILLFVIVLVGAGGYIPQPFLVLQVPVNGFAQPLFKGHTGLPSQFPVYFAGVERIPAVVARPVLYIGNQLFAGTLGPAQLVIHLPAQFLYQVYVFPLVKPADIIGAAFLPFVEYKVD